MLNTWWCNIGYREKVEQRNVETEQENELDVEYEVIEVNKPGWRWRENEGMDEEAGKQINKMKKTL